MSNFRKTVFEAIKAECNNGYTLNGYKLNPDDDEYGDTKLNEIITSEGEIFKIVNNIGNRTGMDIEYAVSRLWVSISDIEKTLMDFFNK